MAKNVEPAVKACNFKKLYNKQYGDIAKMTKAHKYTPEQVFDLAVRYFTWAEENHIQAAETASFQGDVYESKIHKPRVFTLNGFRLFAGLSASVLEKWRREQDLAMLWTLSTALFTSKNSSLPQTILLTPDSLVRRSALKSQPPLPLRITQAPALTL
ncbi:terminase small subunit [Shigella phage pSf-1]|uniref:Uncharacterized protein n=1 Tax=Shigella phage pSf-1 TaxID=2496551 RepID=M9QWW4_9CAUD|nr:terminase small subunit [Shigella phage pSf-1]AGI61443.1 hypothetical protein pSf1_0060 [Shigella phage pSf-1]